MKFGYILKIFAVSLLLFSFGALAENTKHTEDTLKAFSHHGIDVSHHQGEVDWSAVKASGASFAFAKATEGKDEVDPKFHKNWSSMKSNGIPRGAYHFFHPKVDAASQAKHFIKTVSLAAGDLAPVLDIEIAEKMGAVNIDDDIKIWLDLVEKAYGVKPIIYSSQSYIKANLAHGFDRYPLWIAKYSHSVPKVSGGWKTWTFWQHSQEGHIEGVTGTVDLSVFSGKKEDFHKLLVSD